MSDAKTQVFDWLYQSLGTKEGGKSIYKIFMRGKRSI